MFNLLWQGNPVDCYLPIWLQFCDSTVGLPLTSWQKYYVSTPVFLCNIQLYFSCSLLLLHKFVKEVSFYWLWKHVYVRVVQAAWVWYPVFLITIPVMALEAIKFCFLSFFIHIQGWEHSWFLNMKDWKYSNIWQQWSFTHCQYCCRHNSLRWQACWIMYGNHHNCNGNTIFYTMNI